MNERPPPLTLKATARLLRMGEPRLKSHKEGKREPLQDMGGKQRWFAREDLTQLQG